MIFAASSAGSPAMLMTLSRDVAPRVTSKLDFGSRQVLYERFFASDPLTRARILNALYPKRELTDRVRDFLGRD